MNEREGFVIEQDRHGSALFSTGQINHRFTRGQGCPFSSLGLALAGS